MRKLTAAILLALTGSILLQGCKKEEGSCTDKHITDSVEFVHTSMLRHQIGDTIHFKKYRIEKDTGRRYDYIGDESFTLQNIDTPEVIYREEILNSLCDRVVHSHLIVQDFSGKQSLKCQLVPNGSFDDLQFIFQKKDFRVSSLRYNNPNSFYYNQLPIGNKEFLGVNYCAGYDLHAYAQPGAYKDSTFAFYNADYGILKFIINDTLVYERYLK